MAFRNEETRHQIFHSVRPISSLADALSNVPVQESEQSIFLNQGIIGYIQGYHNGHKLSGLGGEHGIYRIEGYLQKRTVYQKF